MLSLFKSSPLLSEEETQWLIDTFVWAFEHFDGDYFLSQTNIITPTVECFPEPVSSIEEMASVVFARVKSYAGLQNWPIQVVSPAQMSAAGAMPKLQLGTPLRGESAQVAGPADAVKVS